MADRTHRLPLPERAGEVARFYTEVIIDAAQQTGRFANRQGLIVAAIVAVAAAVIQAAGHAHVSAWHLVRAALLATGGLCVLAFVWSLVLAPIWREQRAARAARAAEQAIRRELDTTRQDLTNTQYELERAQAAEQVFGQAVIPMIVRDRLVRLAELPPGLWLHDRLFEHCQLIGPAKILVGGGHFEGIVFYGRTDRMFIIADGPEMDRHLADSIVFKDCRILNCEFHNVQVFGNEHNIQTLKQGRGF